MTEDHCRAQLGRLGVLKGAPSDVTEYVSALVDVPEVLFTEAVSHAVKTRAWFPVPAELRMDCDVAARFASVAVEEPRIEELPDGGRTVVLLNPFGGKSLTLKLAREWKHDCEDCRDTGWREHACPEVHCGRRFTHDKHPWVEPCQCREWNPTIRRRMQSVAKYSQAAGKIG